MTKEEFADRLSKLRLAKGVSARDMSLSIGQGESYINNIENCISYPSMTGFFYICEFLGISPKEFFDTDLRNPSKATELLDAIKGLNTEKIEILISVAKGFKP
ncbi:MAG: helix-turn-helix transcriptional regulator [Firmicutes bacterium]|nr:helix-turn-helix transcriptional regulator [Bacillota bacterium]MBR1737716.1 helix-turn-helix transcriptional regulator [Bacillota bacterium]